MSAARELEELLDRERIYILAGSLDEVERLSELKARIVEHLAFEELTDDVATALKSKSAVNNDLLEAAALGIRTALSLLQDARSMVEQSTYERGGKRKRLGPETTVLERRL